MATTTGQQFAQQMNAILNGKIKPQATKIVRKIGLDTYTDLTDHSPVEFGFLKGNWLLAVDMQPPDGELHPEKGKTYPEPPPPNMSLVRFDSYLSFFNNTAYAGYIEHGTEYMYAQPMVFPAQVRLETKLNRIVAVFNQQVIP
jgi:hypothetical protein